MDVSDVAVALPSFVHGMDEVCELFQVTLSAKQRREIGEVPPAQKEYGIYLDVGWSPIRLNEWVIQKWGKPLWDQRYNHLDCMKAVNEPRYRAIRLMHPASLFLSISCGKQLLQMHEGESFSFLRRMLIMMITHYGSTEQAGYAERLLEGYLVRCANPVVLPEGSIERHSHMIVGHFTSEQIHIGTIGDHCHYDILGMAVEKFVPLFTA